jgi:MFS family permease
MIPNDEKNKDVYFGWYVVAAVMFIAFVTTGARSSFGIFIIPLEEEFGWNRFTLSLAVGTGFLVNGITQPFIGHIFDRFSSRNVILVGLLVVGLATVALSLTFHFLFLLFMFGFVLSTAMSGSSITNTMALLSKWFQRKRATAMGMNVAGASLGGLLLVPFGMYLLQATNWRVTWVALGLIVLLLAFPLAFLFVRNDPKEMGLQPDGEAENYALTKGKEVRRGLLEVDGWRESFRSAPIWQISGAYTVCGATTGLISAHFVPYAIGVGVSASLAATIFGVMMGLNVIGGLGAGLLADRFGRKNLLAIVYFLRGIGFVMLLVVPGPLGLWAFAAFAGFSWIASVPLTTSLTADVYGLRALATISGVSFLCHQVGSFASILLAGLLYDITGSYTIPFAIAGAMLFPAALSAFSVKERKYSMRYVSQPAPAGGDD